MEYSDLAILSGIILLFGIFSPHKKEFPGRVKNGFRFLTNKFSGVLKNSKPWPVLAPFFGVR